MKRVISYCDRSFCNHRQYAADYEGLFHKTASFNLGKEPYLWSAFIARKLHETVNSARLLCGQYIGKASLFEQTGRSAMRFEMRGIDHQFA